jgi:hypothetical protein
MANSRDVAAFLAEAYWSRPAAEPELVAMSGEIARDSAWVATVGREGGADIFSLEPAHYTALMLKEAGE